MTPFVLQTVGALCTGTLLLFASGGDSGSGAAASKEKKADIGIDAAKLSRVVDNPYVNFASIRRAVYEGEEVEDGQTVKVRVEAVVRDTPATVAGVEVTVVEVSDYDDGELVEKTEDYYAQHESGVVYYLGERVDDFEDGKVVGHGGQWVAGENGGQVGLFMPVAPKVGDVFEQERTPGVAMDRSTVLSTGKTVTVPAGTFTDCMEVEDYDPVGKTTQRKVYCREVGLVREILGEGQTIDLIEIEMRK
ncbi:MAG TPA: hypothetical protein VFD07_04290 [Candidatus Krumholzibacteria bacterium]|nr:hypothetical protein [Candidatus Krumholzibacteria bacterium]